jgi:hypothetical protein
MSTFYDLLAEQQEPHPFRLASPSVLEAMGQERAVAYVNSRAELIRLSREEPLSCCWEPPIWRQIDLKMVRKRLQFPGQVLKLFVNGGMRPGKTFGCTRRIVAHWLYTKGACVFALAETVETSRAIQQKTVEFFLPNEVSSDDGKRKAKDTLSGGKHERFKFSGGHFTNEQFSLMVPVLDDKGEVYHGGGDFVFRFFTQGIERFQGFSLSAAWSDELVPLAHVKAVHERMATRAADTRKPAFLDTMKLIEHKLENGQSLTVRELGLLYHGVHLVSFTPYLGWNETTNYFLNGAVKSDFEVSPDLEGREGVQDPRVPRFAQPRDPTALVAYIFTSDNKVVPAYEALRTQLIHASEREVRIKLHGDVSQDNAIVFSAFNERHLCDWADLPRSNCTLWEIIDFGKKKPAFVQWWIVDSLGRRFLAQEWPSAKVPINIRGTPVEPGPWAVPSETGRLNGDEGPAYRLDLRWNSGRMVREIWAMRARLFAKLKETGTPWTGTVREEALKWEQPLKDASQTLDGPFCLPYMTIPDPRSVNETVEGATLGEKFEECEHGLMLMRWKVEGQSMVAAPSDDDGIKLLLEDLNTEIHGSPKLRVNRECANMQFMLSTFSLPAYKDGPTRKDEACAESFDDAKYFLAWDPWHEEPKEWLQSSGRK